MNTDSLFALPSALQSDDGASNAMYKRITANRNYDKANFSNGIINFDKIICTQEFLPSLKRFARILGPKGLMPNVKSGTLVSSE